jgi:hypothetical protein
MNPGTPSQIPAVEPKQGSRDSNPDNNPGTKNACSEA